MMKHQSHRRPTNDNDEISEPRQPSRGQMLRAMVELEAEFRSARGKRRDVILRALTRQLKQLDRSS